MQPLTKPWRAQTSDKIMALKQIMKLLAIDITFSSKMGTPWVSKILYDYPRQWFNQYCNFFWLSRHIIKSKSFPPIFSLYWNFQNLIIFLKIDAPFQLLYIFVSISCYNDVIIRHANQGIFKLVKWQTAIKFLKSSLGFSSITC